MRAWVIALSDSGSLDVNRRSRNSAMSGARLTPIACSRNRWMSAIGTTPMASRSIVRGRFGVSPRAPGPVSSRLRLRQADVVASTACWATSPPKEWPSRCDGSSLQAEATARASAANPSSV